MIDRLVYQDFQRRLGSDLSEKQKTRLVKTVRHYMTQVAETIPEEPIQVKNREVLSALSECGAAERGTESPGCLKSIQSTPKREKPGESRTASSSRFPCIHGQRWPLFHQHL